MSTIPVIIQTPETEVPFAHWPVDALDDVIPLIARWGMTDLDGGDLDISSAVGDFVVNAKQVVFRVSVGLD